MNITVLLTVGFILASTIAMVVYIDSPSKEDLLENEAMCVTAFEKDFPDHTKLYRASYYKGVCIVYASFEGTTAPMAFRYVYTDTPSLDTRITLLP